MSAPDRGGRLVDHVHATGAAKRVDAAARRAGWHDPAHAPLSNSQQAVLLAIDDRHGRLEGLAEVAVLTSGVSAASAAVQRLIDLGLASQTGQLMPVVLTDLGRQRAAELRQQGVESDDL